MSWLEVHNVANNTLYSMDFRPLLPHLIGQLEDTSERTRQQPLHVVETLSSQQPPQASGVLHVAAVEQSKFGKQSITRDQLVTYMHVHVCMYIHVHTCLVHRPLP